MDFGELKKFLDHLTEKKVPSNAISIYLDNKNVFNYSSGFADLENKRPMSCDDYIFIYSCSKVTTVVAAFQLIEKGELLLEDNLSDYISEFKNMSIKTEAGKIVGANNKIKICNLLNMTAGFSYDTSCIIQMLKNEKEAKNGTLDIIKCLAKEPLSFEPGTHWQYSLCHDVLAGVIEVVSGKKFSQYVKENIFDPLGMNRSFYHVNEDILSKMAEQYQFVSFGDENDFNLVNSQKKTSAYDGIIKKVGKKNSLIFSENYDSGGAGITTTVNDYVKLCCALSNYGIGLNGNKILNKETIELIKTNTLNESMLKEFNWSQLKGYGYGYGVRTMMDKTIGNSLSNIGEFGWGGAAGATVLVDNKINLAVFYAHHMLNPLEEYYQPRLRNTIYSCLK